MHTRFCLVSVLVACSGGLTNDSGPLGGANAVHGMVVDFQSNMPVTDAATITTSGLLPTPKVTTEGASFTIDAVPDNSQFQLLASAPPTHQATFGPTISVLDADLDDVTTPVVSTEFITGLATAFGVTPTAANGVLLVRVVDKAGAPRANVLGADLTFPGNGPHFLDGGMMPATTATMTSSSGWAVWFEVPPGVATLTQRANAMVPLEMADSPIAAATVTIATATVLDSTMLPTNVSFATQIVPIFKTRGCVNCHSGGGPGKDLGGLTLDGNSKTIYKELVMERPNTRVMVGAPEKSLVLTMPSRETPPDPHPNITFASTRDLDYVKLLVWIREGAKEN